MEERIEKATTSLIVSKDELDAILIAINDSSAKAASVLKSLDSPADYSEAVNSIKEAANVGQDRAEELVENTIELAEFLLSTFPGIVAQIKEVMPEVEDEDKLRQQPPFIIMP